MHSEYDERQRSRLMHQSIRRGQNTSAASNDTYMSPSTQSASKETVKPSLTPLQATARLEAELADARDRIANLQSCLRSSVSGDINGSRQSFQRRLETLDESIKILTHLRVPRLQEVESHVIDKDSQEQRIERLEMNVWAYNTLLVFLIVYVGWLCVLD